MYRKILVAYDGSAGATAALDCGLDLARDTTKELWTVSVQSAGQDFAPPRAVAEGATDRALGQLSRIQGTAEQAAFRAGVTLHAETLVGNVAKSIIEYAGAGDFDLLVVGQSGHSGVWGTFLGTTADKVVRHAPCSVLLVRPLPARGATERAVAARASEPATAGAAATATATATAVGTIVCRACGEENAAGAIVCARCKDVLPRKV